MNIRTFTHCFPNVAVTAFFNIEHAASGRTTCFDIAADNTEIAIPREAFNGWLISCVQQIAEELDGLPIQFETFNGSAVETWIFEAGKDPVLAHSLAFNVEDPDDTISLDVETEVAQTGAVIDGIDPDTGEPLELCLTVPEGLDHPLDDERGSL